MLLYKKTYYNFNFFFFIYARNVCLAAIEIDNYIGTGFGGRAIAPTTPLKYVPEYNVYIISGNSFKCLHL